MREKSIDLSDRQLMELILVNQYRMFQMIEKMYNKEPHNVLHAEEIMKLNLQYMDNFIPQINKVLKENANQEEKDGLTV